MLNTVSLVAVSNMASQHTAHRCKVASEGGGLVNVVGLEAPLVDDDVHGLYGLQVGGWGQFTRGRSQRQPCTGPNKLQNRLEKGITNLFGQPASVCMLHARSV